MRVNGLSRDAKAKVIHVPLCSSLDIQITSWPQTDPPSKTSTCSDTQRQPIGTKYSPADKIYKAFLQPQDTRSYQTVTETFLITTSLLNSKWQWEKSLRQMPDFT